MEPEFQINHHEDNGWTVVEFHGEADVFTVTRIREYVVERIAEGSRRCIFDLLGVRFLDSTGLGALVGIRRRLNARGGTLRLVVADRHIRRIFALTGLHQVFAIYESVDAAKTAP